MTQITSINPVEIAFEQIRQAQDILAANGIRSEVITIDIAYERGVMQNDVSEQYTDEEWNEAIANAFDVEVSRFAESLKYDMSEVIEEHLNDARELLNDN